jgi:hypothetical protein
MRKVFCWVLALGSLPFAFLGCGEGVPYAGPAVILPSHIRKIAIRPIVNKTQFYGLEEKLKLRLEEEFIRDGRLPYVSNEAEADGYVVGEIINYIKEPISFDSNHVVEEYKLWILMDIKFVDRTTNAMLWEEPRLGEEYRYFVETKPGGATEDQAREYLWDLFSRDIVKRTVDGFGSVSGASDRKAPDKTLPDAQPDNAPAARPRPRTPPPSPY